MAYFNGKGVTGMDGVFRYVPMTALYCDQCAETQIPLPKAGPVARDPEIGRHWDTDFKWAPHYGAHCHTCGKAV